MPLRQIIQMALRALEEALAENSSGSDGDLRLADVIASAQRIAFRVEEDEDAVLLVIVQEAEGDGDDGGQRQTRPHEQRSEEHTHELQSLMRISYAVSCL